MTPVAPLPGGPGPGPRPVGASLDRLSASFGGPPAEVLSAVFASWAEVAGEGVAAHARPRSLRHGVLVVVVDDPAWATQLRWLESDLLARLATVAGEGFVTEIQVRVRGA
jgi:predicted nucleic acid-binding Zn ribbon protein